MDHGRGEFPEDTGDDNWVCYSVRNPKFSKLLEKHQEYAGRYATKCMFSEILLNDGYSINQACASSTDDAGDDIPGIAAEPELALTVVTVGKMIKHKTDNDTLRFLAEDIQFPSLKILKISVRSTNRLARLFSAILKPGDLLFVIRKEAVPRTSLFINLSEWSSGICVIFHITQDPNQPFNRTSSPCIEMRRKEKFASDDMFSVGDSHYWCISPLQTPFSRFLSELNGGAIPMDVDVPDINVHVQHTAEQFSFRENCQGTGKLKTSAKKRKRRPSKPLEEDLAQVACSTGLSSISISGIHSVEVDEAQRETQPIIRKKPLVAKHVAVEIKIVPVSIPLDDPNAEHCSQETGSQQFFSAGTEFSSEGLNATIDDFGSQIFDEDFVENSQRLFSP